MPNELSLGEISGLAKQLSNFGLRHIVYSGGEPLLRRDFKEICEIFAAYGVKQTLLTNGLLLGKRYGELRSYFNEIVVSIDGADEQTHNGIRGIKSFTQITQAISSITHENERRPAISIRTVLQKQNYNQVMRMVDLAKTLGVDRISFLAADVLSDSFGRNTRGVVEANDKIELDEAGSIEFRSLINQMSKEYKKEFDRKFISESPEKLLHIAQYFEALIGKANFPQNHCNAPDVSAVITSTGDLMPCFFLPSQGNIRDNKVESILNNAEMRKIRQNVRNYCLERCQTCVCTLKINRPSLLFNRI